MNSTTTQFAPATRHLELNPLTLLMYLIEALENDRHPERSSLLRHFQCGDANLTAICIESEIRGWLNASTLRPTFAGLALVAAARRRIQGDGTAAIAA